MSRDNSATLNMDQTTVESFCKFFRSLPDQPGLVRFFDRKDYYTVHGPHALDLAKQFFKTLSVVKRLGGSTKPLDSLCINQKLFSQILQHLLVETHHRVEVYVAGGTRGVWQVDKKGSSGNLQDFEDILFAKAEMDSAPVLMAVRVEADRVVGVAAVDTINFTIMMEEFIDDEQFTNIEALMLHYGCRECIVPKASPSDHLQRQLNEIVAKLDVLVTERPKSDFATKDSEEDAKRLLRPADLPRVNFAHKTALSCLLCLIRYSELCADSSNFGMFRAVEARLEMFMRLDSGANNALNLFGAAGESVRGTTHLFGLLNQCRSAMGSRTLRRWIKQPLVDLQAITHRQDLVEVFVNDSLLLQTLRNENLKGIADIERLANKLKRGRATLQDCVRVYQVVLLLPGLRDTLGQADASTPIHDEFFKPLETFVKEFAKYEALIEQTLDLEELENHKYLVNPRFNDELRQLKEDKDGVYRKMTQQVSKIARDLDLEESKVHFEENKTHGYVVRITRKDEKALRSKPQYTSLATNKDGVRFTSAQLSQLAKSLNQINEQYEAVQHSIVEEVLRIAASYGGALEDLSGVVADLDAICALAHAAVAAPIPFVRPLVTKPENPTERAIVLRQSRHPCVEVQEGMSFIPNDVDMSQENGSFHIITGPNMGGKSTFIRQVGVIVLMAQIGSFVPCSEARVSVCDRILARVGAADAQLKGMSTFMAEMTETASILKSATRSSLVIVDELGRGTSTYDGFGLAWAISEEIAKRIGAFCLFATHFHELTALSEEVESITNYHVTALTSDDKLTMLYQVRPGACDQSFGIHVAQIARFPQEVIDMAIAKAAELEDFGQGTKTDKVGSKRTAPAVDSGASTKRLKTETGQAVNITGLAEAKAFLNEFKSLPVEEMTPLDVLKHVKEWAGRLEAQIPTIREIVKQRLSKS
eukprot:c10063_g1_i3.p1 GENE.c10063_g1_i3~~c10063_g1_i3.p1  ORF type:complete len:947 (-),score=257.56 c10063_g1_i3:2-2797(-)